MRWIVAAICWLSSSLAFAGPFPVYGLPLFPTDTYVNEAAAGNPYYGFLGLPVTTYDAESFIDRPAITGLPKGPALAAVTLICRSSDWSITQAKCLAAALCSTALCRVLASTTTSR